MSDIIWDKQTDTARGTGTYVVRPLLYCLELQVLNIDLSPVHNVHYVKYDGPVVKIALHMLQGHIM